MGRRLPPVLKAPQTLFMGYGATMLSGISEPWNYKKPLWSCVGELLWDLPDIVHHRLSRLRLLTILCTFLAVDITLHQSSVDVLPDVD